MNLHEANILIVDDDKDVLTAVRFLLKMEVKNILTESDPEHLRRLILGNEIDILLLDMNFKSALNSGNEGLYWLKEYNPQNQKSTISKRKVKKKEHNQLR